MDKNTISLIIILCLEMVWMPVSCSDPELGLENSPIVLVPGPVNNIDRILWKLNSNKAAEWEKPDQIYYYGGFRDGAKLDFQTGNLNIDKLSTALSGAYSVEINSQPSRSFVLNVLKPVPKPECTKKCNDTHCNLTCKGEETQYTQYNWTNNKEQKMSGKEWTVSKTGEMDTKYTCTFSNPLSSSACSVLESEMFPPPAGLSGGKIAGIFFGLLLAVLLAGILFYLWWTKKRPGNQKEPKRKDPGENSDMLGPRDKAKKPEDNESSPDKNN